MRAGHCTLPVRGLHSAVRAIRGPEELLPAHADAAAGADCTHGINASIIARIPVRIALGSSGHASTTRTKSRSPHACLELIASLVPRGALDGAVGS